MINKELGDVQINNLFDSMNNNFEKIAQMAQNPLQEMSETINAASVALTPTVDIAKAIDTNVPKIGNTIQILHEGRCLHNEI